MLIVEWLFVVKPMENSGIQPRSPAIRPTVCGMKPAVADGNCVVPIAEVAFC